MAKSKARSKVIKANRTIKRAANEGRAIDRDNALYEKIRKDLNLALPAASEMIEKKKDEDDVDMNDDDSEGWADDEETKKIKAKARVEAKNDDLGIDEHYMPIDKSTFGTKKGRKKEFYKEKLSKMNAEKRNIGKKKPAFNKWMKNKK
eukprot:c56333_g1_i1.p1 GENE.c56333_g1_i1~~c56333_g1_i1.p1  ORF type:complete len:165 (-),score=1.37 c56333_g1_i1:26-469(-)